MPSDRCRATIIDALAPLERAGERNPLSRRRRTKFINVSTHTARGFAYGQPRRFNVLMQGLRAHVGFGSLAERSFVIELDRLDGVGFVTSQPMWIRWLGVDPGNHAPGFVRIADGSRMFVDERRL